MSEMNKRLSALLGAALMGALMAIVQYFQNNPLGQ